MRVCFDLCFHVCGHVVLKFFPMIRPSFWCEDRKVLWVKRVKTVWIKAPSRPPSDLCSSFSSFASDLILSRRPRGSELKPAWLRASQVALSQKTSNSKPCLLLGHDFRTRVMGWVSTASSPVKTHFRRVRCCRSGLPLFNLSSVCPNTRSTPTYLHSRKTQTHLRRAQRSVSECVTTEPARLPLVLSGLRISRRTTRAIVTNSPTSDKKVSAPPQSLCFVCGAMPVVIALICEVMKSFQGRFVYFLQWSQNILWSVCHQDWDAADNSGSRRISLGNSSN